MEMILNKSIVNSTLTLYTMVRTELLPTPEKSHYLFNLRDVSRVFQGLSLVKQATLNSPDVLVKLWVHEFQRVFEDRLISEKDKLFIREELGKKVTVSLKSNLTQENLFQSPIYFCNFLRKGLEKKDWLYEEAKDYGKLVKVITDVMADETSMNLVLFSEAVAHITRVARAMQFEKGHMLLVGLSGSGKNSMVTLGGVVSQCKMLQIEVRKSYGKAEFREDVYRIMKEAAFENTQVCFRFPENHIIEEAFLEDINNLLSSGEIPCMFSKDNLEEITQNLGYEAFLRRVVHNLHVTITLSPVGAQFRTRLRNYPSLINCCSIDWLDQWPEEALKGVASMKLEDKSVGEACVFAHQQIEHLAALFFS
jgi:dynein heavy chain, axonemal